jgi:protein-tyrosine phosphatase
MLRISEILPYLYIGNMHDAQQIIALKNMGIHSIINVTRDVKDNLKYGGINRFRIPIDDTPRVDISYYFQDAIDFIERARENNDKVLVHCVMGISRSVTIVLAYLMIVCGYTYEDAFDYVKSIRPIINPNIGFRAKLLEL